MYAEIVSLVKKSNTMLFKSLFVVVSILSITGWAAAAPSPQDASTTDPLAALESEVLGALSSVDGGSL